MKKPANLSVYVKPETKRQAEKILNQKGILVSEAVNLFFDSIVKNNGLPSGLEIPNRPRNRSKITKQQLNSELEILTQKINRVWGK